MDIYLVVIIGAATAGFAFGVLLGWKLGMVEQKHRDVADEVHQVALRVNAGVDFAGIRDKADKIVALANEIGTKARTAEDTVHKEFGLSSTIENSNQPSSYVAGSSQRR